MVMEGKSSYCCDNPPTPFLINEDCLIQILLWLPVMSLLRFKSVCKSWRAIIQNPFFIHTHATATTPTTITITTTTTKKVHFLRYSSTLLRGDDILTVSGDDEFEVLEDLGIPGPGFEVFEHEWQYMAHYTNITMAGCCNGIICLHDKDPHKCYIDTTISLWNPAIKQYRFLPIPFALEEDEKNHCGEYEEFFAEHGVEGHAVDQFVGFGFDVKTKDYKVLLITYDIYAMRPHNHARGVQVYSLSTDSWRCIDAASDALPNLLFRVEDRNQGHYLNGTYLFITGCLYEEEGDDEFQEPTTNSTTTRKKCFRNVIMSFDFTKETFRTIQLPFVLKFEPETPNLAYAILFGEKIAVTNAPLDWHFSYLACVDIWVLNEYGGSESWSKFYTFVSTARPKFITDNGEFILLDAFQDNFQDAPKLKLLNVVTGEIKDLQHDCDDPSLGKRYARVGVYKPSLIPITGNGATDTCLHI